MPQINWDLERARLQAVYAAMSDGEPQEVAEDADSLTDVARAGLSAEMLRRGMDAPPVRRAEPVEAERQAPKPVILGRYRALPPANLPQSTLDYAVIESL